MIRTGPFGYLLANGDQSACFPVVNFVPLSQLREQRWARKHGMPPLGTYWATGLPPNRAIYVRTLSWFDRNKRFLESWEVERLYPSGLQSFTFYMRVDGISRWFSRA